jgi:hypothetical protein
MTLKPYESIEEVITDRIEWAISQLASLVARARREGWLAGAEMTENVSIVERRIASRISGTSPGIAPMQVLAERLGLADAQLDLLWLLAAIELSPRVARLAQAFGSSDCPELSVQLVGEIVPISGAALDALERLVLVEVSADHQLPRHRRQLRVNDRVLELARGELRLDHELAFDAREN